MDDDAIITALREQAAEFADSNFHSEAALLGAVADVLVSRWVDSPTIDVVRNTLRRAV